VDTDHSHDLVTMRSTTGIILMLNNTPVRWLSKRQKTLETSTYGSGLVAAKISTEHIFHVRFILWSLGVTLDGPTLKLGDSMSVFLSRIIIILVRDFNSLFVTRHK
jgi:hypothetical protein